MPIDPSRASNFSEATEGTLTSDERTSFCSALPKVGTTAITTQVVLALGQEPSQQALLKKLQN